MPVSSVVPLRERVLIVSLTSATCIFAPLYVLYLNCRLLGLGNNFLANIQSVDGIYHVIRIFEDSDVTHVEGALHFLRRHVPSHSFIGDIDPIRDLDIIAHELRVKDLQVVEKMLPAMKRAANSDPKARPELVRHLESTSASSAKTTLFPGHPREVQRVARGWQGHP